MTKKILAVVVALAMALSMFSFNVFAAEDTVEYETAISLITDGTSLAGTSFKGPNIGWGSKVIESTSVKWADFVNAVKTKGARFVFEYTISGTPGKNNEGGDDYGWFNMFQASTETDGIGHISVPNYSGDAAKFVDTLDGVKKDNQWSLLNVGTHVVTYNTADWLDALTTHTCDKHAAGDISIDNITNLCFQSGLVDTLEISVSSLVVEVPKESGPKPETFKLDLYVGDFDGNAPVVGSVDVTTAPGKYTISNEKAPSGNDKNALGMIILKSSADGNATPLKEGTVIRTTEIKVGDNLVPFKDGKDYYDYTVGANGKVEAIYIGGYGMGLLGENFTPYSDKVSITFIIDPDNYKEDEPGDDPSVDNPVEGTDEVGLWVGEVSAEAPTIGSVKIDPTKDATYTVTSDKPFTGNGSIGMIVLKATAEGNNIPALAGATITTNNVTIGDVELKPAAGNTMTYKVDDNGHLEILYYMAWGPSPTENNKVELNGATGTTCSITFTVTPAPNDQPGNTTETEIKTNIKNCSDALTTVSLPTPVKVGETIKFHVKGSTDDDFRLWLSVGDWDRMSDIITVSHNDLVDGKFDMILEFTATAETNHDAATHLQFKGKDSNTNLKNLTVDYLAIVTESKEPTPEVVKPAKSFSYPIRLSDRYHGFLVKGRMLTMPHIFVNDVCTVCTYHRMPVEEPVVEDEPEVTAEEKTVDTTPKDTVHWSLDATFGQNFDGEILPADVTVAEDDEAGITRLGTSWQNSDKWAEMVDALKAHADSETDVIKLVYDGEITEFGIQSENLGTVTVELTVEEADGKTVATVSVKDFMELCADSLEDAAGWRNLYIKTGSKTTLYSFEIVTPV